MSDCIFCKIVKNEIPCYKVWENNDFLALLTIQPINPGHTLLIPKKHVDYLFNADDQTLEKILPAAKPVADKLTKALKPKTGRVGIMVAGLAVPHAHIHLIPMNGERDLDFSKAKSASPDDLQETLDLIIKN